MSEFRKGHKVGASKSLDLTISEIMEFLGHDERPKGKLRDVMYEKVGDLAERWYRRGFNRGHMESYKQFKTTESVPKELEFECSGKKLCPRAERDLLLTSKIKKAKKRVSSKTVKA